MHRLPSVGVPQSKQGLRTGVAGQPGDDVGWEVVECHAWDHTQLVAYDVATTYTRQHEGDVDVVGWADHC